MDQIHSRWRTPMGRKRGAVSEANREKARKRWENARQESEASAQQQEPETAGDPNPQNKQSTTGRKLDFFRKPNLNESLESGASDISEAGEFIIVHKSFWKSFVAGVVCSQCHTKALKVMLLENHGFVKKIVVQCNTCEEAINQLYTSPRISKTNSNTVTTRPPFLCNRKIVDSFLDIRTSHCGLERFCVAMGMEIISLGSYMDHLHKIMAENEWIKEEILSRARTAVREAYTALDPTIGNDDIIDIHVSFDGSWPTRGHCSLSGFCSVIDTLTGLVVDYIILSKHCHVCAVRGIEQLDNEDFEQWKKNHEENGECDVNYSGSSGKMEVEGAGILWQRSLEKNKMRYTSVLSDGDAKTIAYLNELQPYGEDVIIDKEECVNHVGKRLGTALRNLVQEEKARGVTLGGKKAGALKDTTIMRLQSYYQKAIKSTLPDIPRAQKEINATLDHMNSTDKKPKHSKCPKGVDSWCFYNRAKAKKEKPKSREEMSVSLNDDVYQKVKPIYKRMSEKALLERCVRLSTQNPNESLHSVIWNKCRKEIFVSRRRCEIAATIGVGEFNMGVASMLSIRKSGRLSTQIAEKVDARREDQSTRQADRTQTRAKNKADRKKTNKRNQTKEGPTYAPGAF